MLMNLPLEEGGPGEEEEEEAERQSSRTRDPQTNNAWHELEQMDRARVRWEEVAVGVSYTSAGVGAAECTRLDLSQPRMLVRID